MNTEGSSYPYVWGCAGRRTHVGLLGLVCSGPRRTGVIGIRVPPNNCPAGQLFLGSIVRRTRLPRKECPPPRTLPPRNRCPPLGVCVPQT